MTCMPGLHAPRRTPSMKWTFLSTLVRRAAVTDGLNQLPIIIINNSENTSMETVLEHRATGGECPRVNLQ